MFSLTAGETIVVVVMLVLFAYAIQIINFAAGDKLKLLSTTALSVVCRWQTKRMCPATQAKSSDDQEPVFLDPKTDPEWMHFYVPTYMRQGRTLSFEQR